MRCRYLRSDGLQASRILLVLVTLLFTTGYMIHLHDAFEIITLWICRINGRIITARALRLSAVPLSQWKWHLPIILLPEQLRKNWRLHEYSVIIFRITVSHLYYFREIKFYYRRQIILHHFSIHMYVTDECCINCT